MAQLASTERTYVLYYVMSRRKRPHRYEILYLPFDGPCETTQARAIYTRLSDDDRDSLSHAHQQSVAEQYAASHGYFITAIYRDWRTGFDPDRLALRQLVEDAHSGSHYGVIFYDHTRLHRGTSGACPVVQLHGELPTYQFTSAVGKYDVDQAVVWAEVSRMEVETTRRRSMDQRRMRASAGQWMAGLKPYWLKRDQLTRKVVIERECARAVLQAILQYVGGVPMSRVVQWMIEHAPVSDSHAKWSSGRLRQVFRNPALWGDLAYGRSLIVTEQRGEEVFVLARKVNPDAIPFRVPPLIHRTELERTECHQAGGCERDSYPAGDTLDAMIKANNARASGRPYALEHPLRRRVVCPCGWRMGFRQKRYKGVDKDYGYLVCTRTQQRGKSVVADYPRCSVSGISTLRLWPKVRELFIDAVQNPDGLIPEVQPQPFADFAAQSRSVADEAVLDERLRRTLKLLSPDVQANRAHDRWGEGHAGRAACETQNLPVANNLHLGAEQKRRLLRSRAEMQPSEHPTASGRETTSMPATRIAFDQISLASWSQLLDTLVADVVLNEQAEPTLRWYKHRLQAIRNYLGVARRHSA